LMQSNKKIKQLSGKQTAKIAKEIIKEEKKIVRKIPQRPRKNKQKNTKPRKNAPRYEKQGISYLNFLRYPEHCMCAQVPLSIDGATVPIRRELVYSVTSNAAGFLNIVYDPVWLPDNSNNGTYSNFLINNNSAYDAATTFTGNLAPTNIGNYNMTANAISSFRLVSCAMHIVPQSSVTNMTGTVYGALIKNQIIGGGTIGTPIINTGLQTLTNLLTLKSSGSANLSDMESLRILWKPADLNATQFLDVNDSLVTAENSFANYFDVIVTGAASLKFNVYIYANYEVIYAPGSVLSGLDYQCRLRELPQVALQQLDDSELVTAYKVNVWNKPPVGWLRDQSMYVTNTRYI